MEFYQVKTLRLSTIGEKQLEEHPEIEWGCRACPLSPEEYIKDRIRYYNSRVDKDTKRNPFWGFKTLPTLEEYLEKRGTWPTDNYCNKATIDVTRGFVKSLEEFERVYSGDTEHDHDWLSEGMYYTRVILTPKHFGIDTMSSAPQQYYELGKDNRFRKCEAWPGFKDIIF